MTRNQGEVTAFDWDSKEDVAEREGHIRDTIMYVTVGLMAWMAEVWGTYVQFVKTSTLADTGEVLVFKTAAGDPKAVPLKRVGAQNAGYFSFLVPLRKLNMKVPADRQFNIKPEIREVSGVGSVFVFQMTKVQSVPRNLKEEEETQQAQAQEAAVGQQEPAAGQQ